MEEDAKSVAKMLKSQIVSLTREREERQHLLEVPPDSGYVTLHTGEQLADLTSVSDGQITDNVQPVFLQQQFYINPIPTHVQQVFYQVSFSFSWLFFASFLSYTEDNEANLYVLTLAGNR